MITRKDGNVMRDEKSGKRDGKPAILPPDKQRTISRAQAIESLKHVLPLKPMPDALILVLRPPENMKTGNTAYLTLHGEKASEEVGMAEDPFYTVGRREIPAWLQADPWYVNIRSTGQQTYFTFLDKRDGRDVVIKVLVASELEGAMKNPPTWQDAVDAISGAALTDNIAAACRSLIGSVERNLDNDAKILRDAVRSYISTIASRRPSSIANTELAFKDPDGKVLAKFKIGETEDRNANLKIESVIVACINAARKDLNFLGKKAAELDSGAKIERKDMELLSAILNGNTFWRFFEII